MDKRIIKGLIDEKLEVIQEQFSIIRAYEGKIPIIELDLIMTSIRDLYELFLSLQIENLGSVLPKQAPVVEEMKPQLTHIEASVEKIPEPEAPARVSPSFISMEPVSSLETVETPPQLDIIEPEIPEPPATELEPPVSEFEPPAPESSAPVPEAEHDPNQPHEKYQRITFDLFSDGGNSTLADRLRDGQDRRIADKLLENKDADLRTTIGINEKFLFINELFEGNMRIYDEAIQKLNESTTMAQADMLLLDLKIAHNWDSGSPTVKKFVELVRKKF